jgi:hypothetical protein
MRRLFFATLTCACACVPGAQEVIMEPTPPTAVLRELWAETRRHSRQAPAAWSDAELGEATRLFTLLVETALREDLVAAGGLAPALRRLGYSLSTTPLAQGRAIAAVDLEGPAGGCLVRLGAVAAEVLLQAPHSFFDRHTGVIGLELFDRGSFRAFCFNTSHRFGSRASAEDAEPGADAAHNPRSPLSVQTDAVLRAVPDSVIVQLHGFDAQSAPAEVDAIVSAGAERPSDARDAAALALGRAGVRARRYPEEIDVLGGTGNAQGKLVAARAGGFVHVELSLAARQRLLEPATLTTLAGALEQSLGERLR